MEIKKVVTVTDLDVKMIYVQRATAIAMEIKFVSLMYLRTLNIGSWDERR